VTTAIARAVCFGLAFALCASCSTVRQDSQALIEQGNHKEGLASLEAAMRERPDDPERRIQFIRAREQVTNRLLLLAGTEFGAGRFDAARSAFTQVLGVDADNPRATAGLAAIDTARRQQILIGDARTQFAAGDAVGAELMVKSVLAETPNHPQARDLERELREQERKKGLAVPALRSKLQNPVNLEFREAPLKLVMEALARSAGINFILDREVRPDLKASIFVRGVRVEDALDLIIQNHQLEKKVLSDNTILVYPNTPQKLREHQELVMRTFHLTNADPKQTLNLLRAMLKTKDMFVDERSGMIVMRDTPEVIRAAERLIATQDVADPEVVLDLEILEVSRSKVRDLGITYPSEFTGPGVKGAKLFEINDFTIKTLDVDTGFKFKLLRTDGETKTLAHPSVRVRNREKARVHVGDRVPVISSTIVGTNSTGLGSNVPVTTEQIQYLDVGIKIEAEATIHADDTVAIKINLDVSSLGTQTQTKAGTTAYEVGTRNASTVLRLRDGETQALMGMIRDDDVQAGSGLPFIGEGPVLDRIFGTKRTDRRSRELVLLITPRLVRGVERPDSTLTEFWSGTEAAVRTRSPFVQQVADQGRPVSADAATSATLALAVPSVPAAAAAAPMLPVMLSWKAPASAKAGEEFVAELMARSDGPVKGASVQLRYDPELTEVVEVLDGGFFGQVGGAAVFTPRIDAGLGIVFATMGASGAASTQGAGALVKLRLKSRKAGAGATLRIGSIISVDPANRSLPIEGAVPLELKSLP
jgi:general secretion pathway protein D